MSKNTIEYSKKKGCPWEATFCIFYKIEFYFADALAAPVVKAASLNPGRITVV